MNNEQTNEKTFLLSECIFAWLCYFAGYAFCRCFPVMDYPLGGFLFILALFTTTIIFFIIQKRKFAILPLLVAISAIAISVSLLLSTNKFLYFWAYAYALAAYCYFVYSVLDNNIEKGFSNLILLDFFKAIIILPFCSLGKLFVAMFTGKARASGKTIGKIFLGLVVTIIPTFIVTLLLSYDSNFIDLLDKILDFDIASVFSHIFSFGFAFPIGMFLFGLYNSASENKCKETINAISCKEAYQATKFVPAVTVIAAVIPLVFLYVIFFISQWDYYISGFVGYLPEEFSYAEYAREGFFQLCTVAVINLVIILSIVVFMRRNIEQPSPVLKIVSITFSICTLILISTAIAKMIMYIKSYGLTPKRVYATWFMCLVALIFIIIIISQITRRIKAVAVSFFACVILLTGLSLSNIDQIIAQYNVNRYINGTLKTVDMNAMDDLGDAAIPELVRLAEYLDSKYDTDISAEACESDDELYDQLYYKLNYISDELKKRQENNSFFSKTIPEIKAINALKRIGLLK